MGGRMVVRQFSLKNSTILVFPIAGVIDVVGYNHIAESQAIPSAVPPRSADQKNKLRMEFLYQVTSRLDRYNVRLPRHSPMHHVDNGYLSSSADEIRSSRKIVVQPEYIRN